MCKGNSSMLDPPVPMPIDICRFTQSDLRQSASDSPNSSGTSSMTPVIYTPAIDVVNSSETKRSSRLLSFVAALQFRDYTNNRIDPKGEGADTPTVSALSLATNASSLTCPVAHSEDAEIQRSIASTISAITCIARCFRQLEMLDAGTASLRIETNWAFW